MAIVLDGTSGITSPAGTVGSGTLNSGTTTLNAASGQGTPLTLTSTDATANTQTVYQGTARTFQIGTGNSSSGFANNLFVYDGTAGATVLQQGRSTYSLALQGAGPVAGTGISFPATQNASSDANTLDDYEEGTYTMTWTCTSGTITLNSGSTQANYTKIGRMVFVNAYAIVQSVSTPSGILSISLPFSSSSTQAQGARSSPWISFNSLSAGGNISTAWSIIDGNSSSISVYVGGGTSVSGNFAAYVAANTDARISVAYITNT